MSKGRKSRWKNASSGGPDNSYVRYRDINITIFTHFFCVGIEAPQDCQVHLVGLRLVQSRLLRLVQYHRQCVSQFQILLLFQEVDVASSCTFLLPCFLEVSCLSVRSIYIDRPQALLLEQNAEPKNNVLVIPNKKLKARYAGGAAPGGTGARPAMFQAWKPPERERGSHL
jgi:hypothetical protein